MDLNSKRILGIIIVPSPVVNRVGVSASGNFETILTLSVVEEAVTKEANAEELVLTSRLIEVSVEMCLFLAAAVSRLVSTGLYLDGYEKLLGFFDSYIEHHSLLSHDSLVRNDLCVV